MKSRFNDVELSVIIPFLNAESTISEQLDGFLKQECSCPWEIIVVDNGSTDGSRSVIEQYKLKQLNLTMVDAFDRRGPAYARNVGVRAARGDLLVFCDADDVVTPGWLEALRASLEESDIALCRIDTRKLNAASWVSRLEWIDDNRGGEEETLEDHRAPFPPNLIMFRGRGFAIKREFHEAINGFDETMIAGEDLDYGYRAQMAGAKPGLAYDALLYYRFRPQFKAMINQWRNYGKYAVLLRKKYQTEQLGIGFWRSWATYFLGWSRLILWLLKTRDKEEFALVMRNSAFRLGIFEGCVQYRLNPFE